MSTVEAVSIDLAVQLGTAKMPVHQLLRMGRGAVIALEQHEADDVILLAHDTPIASAQIVVQGERITVTITKMLPLPPERRRPMAFGQAAAPAAQEVAEEAVSEAGDAADAGETLQVPPDEAR